MRATPSPSREVLHLNAPSPISYSRTLAERTGSFRLQTGCKRERFGNLERNLERSEQAGELANAKLKKWKA